MASSLEDELSCPVCYELYQNPLMLSCGHSFCRRCLDKRGHLMYVCPVCQCKTLTPVVNLILKSACKSYLREKESESEAEVKCPQHGEKIQFFCDTDEKVICSKCRKLSHSAHKVQRLANAVRQRKEQIKTALRPAEKFMEALQNGTAQHAKFVRNIQFQAKSTERQLKKEFQKFYQLLKEQEESRITTLRAEEVKKTEDMETWIEQHIQSLSTKVQAVRDEMENDDVQFLQNYHKTLQRAQYTVPDVKLDSAKQIDVANHIGNLQYRVWKKMQDISPYYPVVLDPRTAPGDFSSISHDLTCVGKSVHDIKPLPHLGNSLVLGYEGYTHGFHSWDIEVGSSRHWTLGVCRAIAGGRPVQCLEPSNGFWGLSREGDSYKLLNYTNTVLYVNQEPRIVRVKLPL